MNKFMKLFYSSNYLNKTKFAILSLILMISVEMKGQITYYSNPTATDFNNVTSWGTNTNGTGTNPGAISNADNFVVSNGSILTMTANADVRNLTITSGTLNVSTYTLTVSLPSSNTSVLLVNGGTFNMISGSNVIINGKYTHSSGVFNQSGGSMTLDPNDNNNASTSTTYTVSNDGTFWFSSGTLNCTAGSITIVDPPINTVATNNTNIGVSIAIGSTGQNWFTGSHTFYLGDGSSTTPGNADGFIVETYLSGYSPLRNLVVNGNGTNRHASTSNRSSTSYGMLITGDLTVNAGSELRNVGATGSLMVIGGNITNNGIITVNGSTATSGLIMGVHAGVLITSIATTGSTVSGSGVFRNAVTGATALFSNITFNNPYGITFNSGTLALGSYTGTVSGTMVLSSGKVTATGQTIIVGLSTASLGTFTYTAGGFGTGTTFGRWYTTSGTGTTIAASTIPTFGVGSYPFVSGTFSSGLQTRHFHKATAALTTGGTILVTYNDGFGVSTLSPSITETVVLDRQSNCSWDVSYGAGAASTATVAVCLQGQSAFPTNTLNQRLIIGTSALVGTHQAGTTQPMVQRTAIPAANFVGTYKLLAASADIPNYTIGSGAFNSGAIWATGSVPTCGQTASISYIDSVTIDASQTISCGSITNNGKLALTGGSLTVGCTNKNDSFMNNGKIYVSGGTWNMNGSLRNLVANTRFWQTGGTINIDGNSGTVATSVASGTPMLSWVSGVQDLMLTGGNLNIINPHKGATATNVLTYSSTSTPYPTVTTGHTLTIGNGSSTIAPGVYNSGFVMGVGTRYQFGNLVINSTAAQGRSSFSTASNVIHGNLTVTKGCFIGSTTASVIGGNVTNNDTLIHAGAMAFAKVLNANMSTPTQTTDSVNHTITTGASGKWFNNSTIASATANIGSITVNSHLTLGSVTFAGNMNQVGTQPANSITMSGTLLFTSGRMIVPTGTKFIMGTQGSTNAVATLTHTAGGFATGSDVAHVWTTSNAGSATFTAGTAPTLTVGKIPFITSAGVDRSIFINRSGTLTTQGFTSCIYTETAGMTQGLTITDPTTGYVVNNRSNDKWNITHSTTPASGIFALAILAPNVLGGALSADSTRITQASTIVGTHLRGLVAPTGFRTTMTSTQMTGDFYIGVNNNETPNVSLSSGDWNTSSTWSKGTVPVCSENVIISSGHNVTISSGSNNSKNVSISTGGTLSLSSGTLTVGCTDNNALFLIDGGAFTMSGGTLNCNGKFALNAKGTGTFTQTAGDIIVDANSGVLATSAAGHIVDLYAHSATALTLTGGTFTVVDPCLSASTGDHSFKIYPTNSGYQAQSGVNWVLNIGNGSTTGNRGGHSSGFLFNTANASTSAFKINGPVNVNMRQDSANRFINLSIYTALTDLNITKGDVRTSSTTYISGNLTNNDTFSGTTTLNFGNYLNGVTPSSQPQTIGGTGVYRNNTTPASVTANLAIMTVNNNHASGLTLNTPISVSSTLTMTDGIINTTSTNYLRLGTTTSTGTLSYSWANTRYVNGPFERYTIANQSPTASGTAITHPVGDGGNAMGMLITPKTAVAGPVIMRAQAYNSNFGMPGAGVTNMSGRTWFVEPTAATSANFLGTFVGMTDTMTNGSGLQKILQSNLSTGSFDGTPGGSAYYNTGAFSLRQGVLLDALTFVNWYSYGDLSPCTAPTGSISNPVVSLKTNTSAQFSFDPITPPFGPTGYLILVDSGTTGITMPVDGTSYNVTNTYVASLKARVVGTLSVAPFTISMTGLLANTAVPAGYDVYVIPYNNSGCAGPVYDQTATTVITNFITCAAAVAAPTVFTYSNQSSSGFNIGWTATATAGTYNYYVQVATNSTFTSFVPGYIDSNIGGGTTFTVAGLNPGTTYFVRVRAQDATSGCVSPYLVGASIATECNSTVSTFSENFDALASGTTTTVFPSCWKKVTSTTSSTNCYITTTNFSAPNSMLMSGTTTVQPVLSMPLVNNANAGTHRLRFKMYAGTAGSKMYLGYLTNAADPSTFFVLDSFSPTVTGSFVDYNSIAIAAPFGVSTLAFKHSGSNTSTFYFDNINYEPMPSCTVAEAGSITSTSTGNICAGSGVTFSATGFNKDSLNLTYQWQLSTNGGATWTTKGSTLSAYSNLKDTPFVATSYRLWVECSSSGTVADSSNVISLTVTSPSILTTTADTTCGLGSVTLIATGTDTAFNWYNVATGGVPLGTNDTFTTTISKDSTFYVETGVGVAGLTFAGDGNWNHVTSTGSFQTTTSTGAKIIVTSPITISSVDIYPSAAIGTAFSIAIRTGSAGGTTIATYNGVTSVQNSGTPTVAETHMVNFTLAPGTYWMNFPTTNPNTWRSGLVTHSFPWVLAGGAATLDYDLTPSYQYYFYNLKVGSGCFSSRIPVTAKSLTPPTITPVATPATICQLGSSTISVSSTNTGYTYNWSDALGSGSSYSVSPMTTKTYSVTATDISGGAFNGCSVNMPITVNVNQTPSAITFNVTDTAFACANTSKLVTFNGGRIAGNTKLGTGTLGIATTYMNPLYAGWENVKLHVIYTAAELTAAGITPGVLDTLGFYVTTQSATYDVTDFSVKMAHTTNTSLTAGYGTPTTGFTTVFPSSNIGKPAVGVFKMPLSTPFVWNGTDNLLFEFCKENDITSAGILYGGTTTLQGTASASNAVYGQYNDNITQCGGGAASTIGSSPNRINLYMSFTKPLNKVWSPSTGLFIDQANTMAYSGTSIDTVHANPSATSKYFLTVTDPTTGCFIKDSILDSLTSSSSNIVLASSSTSGAVAQCTEPSGWTYYSNPSTPGNWMFAINKGTSGMTGETISVEVLGSNPSSSSSAGTNQEHGSFFMKRGWDVTGTVPTGSVSVRFFYDPADSASAVAARDADSIAKKTANSSSLMRNTPFKWFKSSGTPYNAAWRSSVIGNKFPSSHVNLTPSGYGTLNGISYVEFSGITSFSGGSGGAGYGAPSAGGGVGLPVTWASFDVKALETGNRLTWSTASEQNTDYFQVEYSYNGSDFTTVPAKIKAAGNSQVLTTYNSNHTDFNTFVYYRIKQVDLDGRTDYSVIKSVKRTAQPTFTVEVYPIPLDAKKELNLKLSAIDMSQLFIKMTDITGKVMVTKSIAPNSSSYTDKIDMSNMANGIYFIEVKNAQGKQVIKVLK